MSQAVVDRFVEALNALESQRHADPIAGLFAEEAEVANALSAERDPQRARAALGREIRASSRRPA